MSNRVLTILAGGSSRRFQDKESQQLDKVLMEFNEKPLLVHFLEKGHKYYDLVSISVNSKKRRKTYSKIVNSHLSNMPVEYVIDDNNIAFEGVLKGICSSMNYFVNKTIQFVSSDRPYLLFGILNNLKVKQNGVSLLRYSDGMIEPLLALYGPDSRIPPPYHHLPLSRADVPIRLAQSVQTYSIEEILEKNKLSYDVFANVNVKVNLNEGIFSYDAPPNFLLPRPVEIEKKALNIFTLVADPKRNISDIVNLLMEKEHYFAAYLWILYASFKKKIDIEMFRKLGKDALLKEKEYWKEKNISFLEFHALQDLIFNFPEEQTKENMKLTLQLKEKMKIKPRRF